MMEQRQPDHELLAAIDAKIDELIRLHQRRIAALEDAVRELRRAIWGNGRIGLAARVHALSVVVSLLVGVAGFVIASAVGGWFGAR